MQLLTSGTCKLVSWCLVWWQTPACCSLYVWVAKTVNRGRLTVPDYFFFRVQPCSTRMGLIYIVHIRKEHTGWVWWHRFVIQAPWKADTGGWSWVQTQSGQHGNLARPCLKFKKNFFNLKKKSVGYVVQYGDPEFNPHLLKKKERDICMKTWVKCHQISHWFLWCFIGL